MTGNKSTPKKDRATKVVSGQMIKAGQILIRGLDNYKAGKNVKGLGTLYAFCRGQVYFTRKKTSRGRFRTFINVKPA